MTAQQAELTASIHRNRAWAPSLSLKKHPELDNLFTHFRMVITYLKRYHQVILAKSPQSGYFATLKACWDKKMSYRLRYQFEWSPSVLKHSNQWVWCSSCCNFSPFCKTHGKKSKTIHKNRKQAICEQNKNISGLWKSHYSIILNLITTN